jgi:hypothetical protein
MQEPAPGGGETQADADETPFPLGDEVAAIRRAGISPSEEVQVVPREFAEMARRREPFGLTSGAVDERARMSRSVSDLMGESSWVPALKPRGPRF